jgi:hypothetical protein
VQLHSFLTSAPDGGERSNSHPGRFNPEDIILGTEGIESWVSPKAHLHILEKGKSLPLSAFEPRIVQPVA